MTQNQGTRERDGGIQRENLRGAEISYVERGSGTPVLLVHGSLSDYRTWSSQLRTLASSFRVIACSLRYHYPNASPAGDASYTPMQHADDLKALVERLQTGPVHIAASSYGAYAALHFAQRHPRSVRSIVLGEPPVLPLLRHTPEGSILLQRFMTQAWEPSRRAIDAGDLETALRCFVDGVMGSGKYDALPAAARTAMLQNGAAKAAELKTPLATHFPDFTREDGARIEARTLLLTGGSSARMFHVITDELEKRLPGCRRVVIPGASHTLHSSNPPVYNRVVLEFLEGGG